KGGLGENRWRLVDGRRRGRCPVRFPEADRLFTDELGETNLFYLPARPRLLDGIGAAPAYPLASPCRKAFRRQQSHALAPRPATGQSAGLVFNPDARLD